MAISSVGGGGSAWHQAAAQSAVRSSNATRPETEQSAARQPPSASATQLSEPERRQLTDLQARDREVRAHEMAHVAAGAGLVTRGASYTYQTGPDGQRYAIGGEVGIDTSPGRTPEESLAKAERIRAAALAPAEPSGQDRQVASQAARMASEARMEIARREFQQDGGADPAAAARVGTSYSGQQLERAYGAEPRAAAMFATTA